MRNCCVPGCNQKQRNAPRRPMFLAPKHPELLAKWTEALSLRRPLKPGKDRVCHLHFHEHEMEKSFKHVINGQIYQLDRDRARLKANVVPTLELSSTELPRELKMRQDFKSTYPKRLVQELSAQDDNEFPNELLKQAYLESEEETFIIPSACDIEDNNSHVCDLQEQRLKCERFNKIFDDVFDVILPNTRWGIHRCPQRTSICFACMDLETLSNSKLLTIDESGNVSTYDHSCLLQTFSLSETATTSDISDLLAELNDTETPNHPPF